MALFIGSSSKRHRSQIFRGMPLSASRCFPRTEHGLPGSCVFMPLALRVFLRTRCQDVCGISFTRIDGALQRAGLNFDA